MIKSAIFLMAMSTLDMRDLWYKIQWVGPFESYSFKAGSRGILQTSVQQDFKADSWASLAMNGLETERASGWSSFFSRCERLTPFCDDGDTTFFLSALGTNCSIDTLNASQKFPQLVMTSSLRPDSMAWAACRLLFDHRKPLLCAQPTVTAFYERYRFRPVAVPSKSIAPVDSNAETELLNLLSLIARSVPRQKMICMSGFAYTTPGTYLLSIYGCASANVYEAAFVGFHARQFFDLQYNMAWLATMDVVSVVGLTYGIRENAINHFVMEEEQTDSNKVTVSVTEVRVTDFASYGVLYVAMILIDVLLLLAQMYTGYELVQLWIIPIMKNQEEFEQRQEELVTKNLTGTSEIQDHDASIGNVVEKQPTPLLFSKEEYVSFLSTSLFRHRTFSLLTVTTQLLSWRIIIPNSVIWTWSLSSMAKLQAYLTTLRLWVLIVIGVNAAWDIVVAIDEKKAYAVTRVVFVSPFEVIGIGALCAYRQSQGLRDVSETKFAFEEQRVNDVTTFPGYTAHGNTFNIDQDGSFGFNLEVLRILYSPLYMILAQSAVGVVIWLIARYVLTHVLARLPLRRFTRSIERRVHISSKTSPASDVIDESESMERFQSEQAPENYKRTTLEQLLNVPMRARSLVRPTRSMQKIVNNETVIRPHISIEYGVFISHHMVTARTGFELIIPAKARLPLSSNSLRFSRIAFGKQERIDKKIPEPRGALTSRDAALLEKASLRVSSSLRLYRSLELDMEEEEKVDRLDKTPELELAQTLRAGPIVQDVLQVEQ